MANEYRCDKCGWEWDNKDSYQNHIYTVHTLDTESYIERYQSLKEEVPEGYKDTYETYTGEGCGPRTVAAAIEYIETRVTLEDMEKKYDKSGTGIRDMIHRMIDDGVVSLEYIRENNFDQFQKFGECRTNGVPSPD